MDSSGQGSGGFPVETRGISKSYGAGERAVRAVEKLDLKVRKGEVFGLLGPNGAGKTTTLRMLCGLLAPTGGEAFIDGVSVTADPDRARSRLGLVPGEGGHIDILTAKEELEYYASFYGIDRSSAEALSAPLLERLGLKGRENDRVGSYSKGMRRKLHLVRALLHEPPILILDEPTSGLDPSVVEEVWGILKSLSADRGVTILFSSHQLEEVERLCDRIAVIKGSLLAEGTLEELAGGGRFEVVLEGDAGAYAGLLSEAEGVFSLRSEGGRLEFKAAAGSSDSPVPGVVRKLAAAGAGILKAGPVEKDLRALYRSIVGGEGPR